MKFHCSTVHIESLPTDMNAYIRVRNLVEFTYCHDTVLFSLSSVFSDGLISIEFCI